MGLAVVLGEGAAGWDWLPSTEFFSFDQAFPNSDMHSVIIDAQTEGILLMVCCWMLI